MKTSRLGHVFELAVFVVATIADIAASPLGPAPTVESSLTVTCPLGMKVLDVSTLESSTLTLYHLAVRDALRHHLRCPDPRLELLGTVLRLELDEVLGVVAAVPLDASGVSL
jgi:hypothetical protein